MLKKLILAGVFLYAWHANAQTTCTLKQITGQTNHQVTLNWLASSATFSVGYNVYRAPGTCTSVTSCSSWSKIVGLTGQLSTTDTNVTAGSTYSYYITAQDVSFSNSESVPSNICTGTVPNPSSGGGGTSQTPPPGTLSGNVQ